MKVVIFNKVPKEIPTKDGFKSIEVGYDGRLITVQYKGKAPKKREIMDALEAEGIYLSKDEMYI
jgi:copper chaperone CopZ